MVSMAIPGMEILRVESVKGQGRCRELKVVKSCHGGRFSVGRVDHGPPKVLVGWATMHLAPPIIGLYVR